MKMRSFFRMGVLLTAICLTAAGCGKDDKTPEQLPDPLDTTTEYYLVGVVSSAEGVVKGAEVKITDDIKATTDAQGKYNLTLSKTGDYTVTVKASKLEDFSTKVNIASSAKKRSTLTLNVQMSKVVEYTAPKEAVSGQETKVEVPAATETETPAAIVTAPANAMDEGVKISAGAYEEPKANVSANATAKKDIVIATPNPSANVSIYFDPDNMVAQKDATLTRAWEDLNTEVKFNNGNYEITIPTGTTIAGKYATRIKAEKVTSKETVGEANLANGAETVKKDNSGNISGIKDFEIKVAIKAGWEYTTTPAAALKAAGAEDEKLAAAIEAQIRSTEGNPLVYTVERVLKTNISGNSILYYQNKAKYCTKTYTFKIMANGVKKNVTIALKCYTGSEEKYTNQSSDQHSGGGTL